MRIVTHQELIDCTGCSTANAERHLPWLNKAMSHYQVNRNRLRIAAFLAQVGHESAGLTRMVENLNYSKERLLAVWPTRFNEYSATTYARQPEAIANYVYANRMGNGPEYTGDGWKYRGRGHIQLTFLNNYKACQEDTGLRIVDDPDLVTIPENAAIVSCWYWDTNRLNQLADDQRFEEISKVINQYDKQALKKRREAYVRALRALK